MDREVYERMAEIEDRHWWFVARRAVLSSLIARLDLPDNPRILEAGCGTGGNLGMLATHGRVFAFEPDGLARSVAQRKAPVATVNAGALPGDLPFPPSSFDMVCAFDVLEHVDDDRSALLALSSALKPTGYLVITVPALPWLWSAHADAHHHRRRYRARGLLAVVEHAGFSTVRLTHFNMLLFPLVVLVRVFKRLLGRSGVADDRLPPRWLNLILAWVLGLERHLLSRWPLPFGVSLLLVARRRADAGSAPLTADDHSR